MKRTFLVAATSSLVLAVAPGTALAHHKRHHHKRHHTRVVHKRFGNVNGTTPTPGTTTTSSGAIGTVDSFTNNVLTIKLNDGSTVSGTVTNDTELKCMSSSSTSSPGSMGTDLRHDGGGDGSNGGSDTQGSQGGDNQGGDNGQGDDDNGQEDDQNQQQSCTTSNLSATPAPSVAGAELKISSAGAVWEKVDLIS